MPFLGGKLKCIARDLKSDKCHFLLPQQKKQKNILRENTHCLNFCRTPWSGVPNTLWILETWSNSLIPGKSGFRLKHRKIQQWSYPLLYNSYCINKFCPTNPQTVLIQVPQHGSRYSPVNVSLWANTPDFYPNVVKLFDLAIPNWDFYVEHIWKRANEWESAGSDNDMDPGISYKTYQAR